MRKRFIVYHFDNRRPRTQQSMAALAGDLLCGRRVEPGRGRRIEPGKDRVTGPSSEACRPEPGHSGFARRREPGLCTKKQSPQCGGLRHRVGDIRELCCLRAQIQGRSLTIARLESQALVGANIRNQQRAGHLSSSPGCS